MKREEWWSRYGRTYGAEVPIYKSGTLILKYVREEQRRRKRMANRWSLFKRLVSEISTFLGCVLLFAGGICVILVGLPLIAALVGVY